MGYLDSLLHVRLGAIMLMGALAGATTGLAGYSLKQLQDNKDYVKNLSKTTGIPAKLQAQNVTAAVALTASAAGLAFIVAIYSEFQLYRERKMGHAPWHSRLITEALLIFSAIVMLGGAIASTIIVLFHNAVIKINPMYAAALPGLIKSSGRSLRYRDYYCYYAMILSWVTFAALLAVVILVILAGLYYRKQARVNRNQYPAHEEKHSGSHIDA